MSRLSGRILLSESVRPPVGTVEDGENLDFGAEPIESDIGRCRGSGSDGGCVA